MKAILNQRYGPPEGLRLADVDKPTLTTDDAILVRVRAASVNAYDWHMMRGKPYVARVGQGIALRGPRDPAFGVDAAGVVEDVGPGVLHVRPGDEVFGARSGAFAEYVSGRMFVRKPANLTCEEAAALPMAGTTALQAVRDHAAVQPGQRVVVTGAGGGVGMFAVQIAKAHGAHVTAVTSTDKLGHARSIGADDVIDYRRGDFTRTAARFDTLIDAGGYRRWRDLRRLVAPGGTLVAVGPGRGDWVGPIVHVVTAIIRTKLGKERYRPFLAKYSFDDMNTLRDLAEARKIHPVIDRTYPLEATGEAVRYLESGAVRGKVVVTVGGSVDSVA
jgi:NADPH:quinone reductase-like Zn-dependent oxidoreductase